jgi:hypothetical protein
VILMDILALLMYLSGRWCNDSKKMPSSLKFLTIVDSTQSGFLDKKVN